MLGDVQVDGVGQPRCIEELLELAHAGDIKALNAFVESHPGVLDWPHIWGGTVLHCMANSGSTGAVRALLAVGVNPNARNDFGESALLYCCMCEKIEAAKCLLESGADPNICNNIGDYPLQVATEHGSLELVEMLLEHGARTDVRSDIGEGETILYFLRSNQEHRGKIAELLIKYGADPNSRCAWIDYSILDAVERRDLVLLEVLVSHGARTDVRDREDRGVRDLLPVVGVERQAILKLLSMTDST